MSTKPCGVTLLHPGDIALGEHGDRFETLLGSCVSIILTDPRRTVGAMCHIVHARAAPRGSQHDTTYAQAAFDAMVARLRARGLAAHLCDAFVIGGGNMFPRLDPNASIGDDNVARAKALLAAHRIRLIGQDVGGNFYRRARWSVGPAAPEVLLTKTEQ